KHPLTNHHVIPEGVGAVNPLCCLVVVLVVRSADWAWGQTPARPRDGGGWLRHRWWLSMSSCGGRPRSPVSGVDGGHAGSGCRSFLRHGAGGMVCCSRSQPGQSVNSTAPPAGGGQTRN